VAAVDNRLERYAELAVRVGANVQPGQEVFIYPDIESVELGRALARQAYKAGASYVHVLYRDDHVRRAMIELGPDSALTYSPEWLKALLSAGDGNASIGTTGSSDPQLLADLDGERVGRAMARELAEIRQRQHHENTVNWSGIGGPNPGWAKQVFGEPDVERLWEAVAFCMRLDEDDPVAAWQAHLDRLESRGAALTALQPDAIHYRGPGTDLTVGLLPTAKWASARFRTSGGIPYVANMPTEEIFTSPDPRRAEGTIRSSMPLVLGGRIVKGLALTFADGKVVSVDAEEGADLVRTQIETNDNADRLGELALVTKESRVGQSGLLYYDTLFDENATCHIAYGMGLGYCFDGEPDPALNHSNIHVDFMVGGPELEVDAVLADGTAVPLIRDETWQYEE
jgi:aminopeptidase